MDENTSPADLDDNDTAPLSPAEQVRTLVADVRALAEAEIDYAKARLSYSGGIIRKAGIWAFLAIFFFSGAIIALILGLLLILSQYLGPWLATAIVVVGFALAAWGAGQIARRTAHNLKFDEGGDNV